MATNILFFRMCDIIHQRHYKLWLRSDKIFNLTTYAKMQEKLMAVIHGLTKKVVKTRKEEYINNTKSGNGGTYLDKVTKIVKDKENKEKLGKKTNAQTYGLKDDLDFNDENDVGMYYYNIYLL